MQWFHNNCAMTFCPSEQTRQYLFQKDIKHVGIMRRGVDSVRFNPTYRSRSFRSKAGAGDSTRLFTYVGRISPEKDLDILIDSILQLKPVYGDRIAFAVVGDGPYRAEIEKKLGKNAYFTGYLRGKDLSVAYASSDALVFPSTTETFGNAVLEGMCSGLPAIVPNAGGVVEIVTHGKNGFIVQPRDSKAFANAIQTFMETPQLFVSMRDHALRTAQKRSWEFVFSSLFDSYSQLLLSKNG